MNYAGTFADVNVALLEIIQHTVSFGIQITSVVIDGGNLSFTTDAPVPEDQLEHLGIQVV